MSGRIAALLLGLALTALTQSARADIVTVTVESSGATLQEATSNALVEAIRQVNGVSISSSQIMNTISVSGAVTDSAGGSTSFSLEQKQQGSVTAKAGGHLAGYRVLEARPSEYGHHAVLEVRVHRYSAPGIDSSNRRKLAVIPFGTRLGEADFYGSMSAAEVGDLLHQAIVAQFVQSRRFAILDRESWNVIGAEHALLASPHTPVSEKAKLGRVLGADYLVVGEIIEARGGAYTRTQQLTGVSKAVSSASLSVAYRVVVPATGEIKFADTVELTTHSESGRQLNSRTAAVNELARQLVGVTLDRIYPIKVVNVQGADTVVLNQGGTTLAAGDQLTLIEEGAPLIDPYTKEPLGRVENPIGTLEVTRSDGKVAYARLVEPPMAPLKAGQLARRGEAFGTGGAGGPPVPPPSERTEGVRLPFDN